jgi:hypothetical protein
MLPATKKSAAKFHVFMYLGCQLKINIALYPLKKRQNVTFPPDRGVWWNRNRDSCEKGATGMENTGIRRIPAGIGNLG